MDSRRAVLGTFCCVRRAASRMASRSDLRHRWTMDRRSSPRLDLNAPVAVSLIGSGAAPVPGTLENISESGMMVALGSPLGVGETVQIDSGDDLMISEVCHCEQRDQQYIIGLRVNEWSDKGALRSLLGSFEVCA